MNYRVEFSERGISDFKDLSRSSACILLSWLEEYIEGCRNPRVRGRSITGEASRWRYKVGRYRLLAEIQEDTVTILAVTNGQGVF